MKNLQAIKLLKSQCNMPWGSSKFFLSIYYFSLPDEGGENKIYQFLGFLVHFWKFGLRQGGLSFYGSCKGHEGADTDLMFQFCLPNWLFIQGCIIFVQHLNYRKIEKSPVSNFICHQFNTIFLLFIRLWEGELLHWI